MAAEAEISVRLGLTLAESSTGQPVALLWATGPSDELLEAATLELEEADE